MGLFSKSKRNDLVKAIEETKSSDAGLHTLFSGVGTLLAANIVGIEFPREADTDSLVQIMREICSVTEEPIYASGGTILSNIGDVMVVYWRPSDSGTSPSCA